MTSRAGARGSTGAVRAPEAQRPRALVPLLAAGAFLVVAVVIGVLTGPAVGFGVGDTVRELLSRLPFLGVKSPLTELQSAVVWQIRVPRVVLALLVGAMLATAGGAYQGVFRNPLADPYLLGVASGAGLGATVVIVYGPAGSGSSKLVPIVAFAGASLAVLAAVALGRVSGSTAGLATLILAGVTVSAFLTAVQTFLQEQNTDVVREVYSWILGRLTTSGWTEVLVVLPYVAFSLVVLVLHRRILDALALGDSEAASLGIDVARVRILVVGAATLGTAAAVAVSGLIGFVGIIVPHTVRLMFRGGYRLTIPLAVVVGGGFLVLADVVARTVLSPSEIPIGVVTAFIGAPFFAIALRSVSGRSR